MRTQRLGSPHPPSGGRRLLRLAASITALAVLAAFVPAAAQQEPEPTELKPGEVPYTPLLTPDKRAAIAAGLDAKRARRHIERLARTHRLAPSDGLDEAMRYIARELKAAGLSNVTTTRYASDGTTTWWVEPAPPAWTCDAAELWIEEPDRHPVADWAEAPITVAAYSTSCDLTADVVEVTDWDAELDLAGKIVLTSGDAETAHDRALAAGAAGLLLAPAEELEYSELLTAVYASSLSPAVDDWETNLFAFNISTAEASALRAALHEGKPVRARALIKNARTAPSTCPIVSAEIEAADPSAEVVLLLAEVAGPKPGANQLSGAGALLSLARSTKELIDDGALLSPTRTIRFVFVPDVHGAQAYVKQHTDELDDIAAVIHLGIVGSNTQSGPATDRPLQIDDGGWIVNTYIPYVALTFSRYVGRSGLIDVAGTDAPLTVRMHQRGPIAAHSVFLVGRVARPAVSISYFPDASTATSLDTADRIDTTALRRTMYMAAGTAYFVASPTPRELQRFAVLLLSYVRRDVVGGLAVFALRVQAAATDRLAATYYYCNAIIRSTRQHILETVQTLDVPLPGESTDGTRLLHDKTKDEYDRFARPVDAIYTTRRSRENANVEPRIALQRIEARLRREVAHMRWDGPVTERLLQRRAPDALPIPDGVHVPTLFAAIDGERDLFDVWALHESLKWIGFTYPLPPPGELALPVENSASEIAEFLRRCASAGVIRIEPKQGAGPAETELTRPTQPSGSP